MTVEDRSMVFQGSDVRGLLASTYTARCVDVDGRYPEAKAWLEDCGKSPERFAQLEGELLESLKPATQDSDITQAVLYRGRYVDPVPRSAFEFGPPDKARANRYNAEGTSALYLCSSEQGVMKELGAGDGSRTLWVQRYLPIAQLRVADAREFSGASLAEAVLYLIESERGAQHPKLGHRIGALIASQYDGLVVPGVRGDEQVRYWNVVIFRPHDKVLWRTLIDQDFAPRRIS